MTKHVRWQPGPGYGKFTFSAVFGNGTETGWFTRETIPMKISDDARYYQKVYTSLSDFSQEELKLIIIEFAELTRKHNDLKSFFKPLIENLL